MLHTAKKLRSTTTGIERVLVSVQSFNDVRCCYDLNSLVESMVKITAKEGAQNRELQKCHTWCGTQYLGMEIIYKDLK